MKKAMKLNYDGINKPKLFIVFLYAILLLQFYQLFFGEKGALYYQTLIKEIERSQEQKSELTREVYELKKEISAIQSSNKANQLYEDYARENLGLIKKDEVFFQLYQSTEANE